MANRENFVRPGDGLSIEHVQLGPVKNELRAGTYQLDGEAQEGIQAALADPIVSTAAARSALDHPENKGFRNAYTSIIMEGVWPTYEALISGDGLGLYALRFADTVSVLDRLPEDVAKDRQAGDVADLIAASNQDVPTHLICQAFTDGKVPVISGNPATDRAYFEAFREQTDLITLRAGNFFRTVPEELDSPTKFIASGLLVLRTHVFGLPNLMDGVAEGQGFMLTPDQHRTGMDTSLRASIARYYLPTGPVTVAINSQLVDPKTRKLRPEQWTSNYDPDAFMVFPLPRIVRSVNDSAARQQLPPQTNCPVFHSRVENRVSPGQAMPLPRSLARMALGQLDKLYYPKRAEEYERRPRNFLVELPDAIAARTPEFPRGLFVPGRYNTDTCVTPAEAPAVPELTEREKNILHGLGVEKTSTPQAFSAFMSTAQASIVEELGLHKSPPPQYRALQRFYRRLLVDMDGAFDANRAAFAGEVASGAEAFLEALQEVSITRLSGLTFSAGEALTVFDKVVADPRMYPPEARAVIQKAAHTFMNVGVAEVGRRDSTRLNGREAQTVKEMTNGLYAGLLFDIAYGAYSNHKGYAAARDRFIAIKLAYQYHDDALDVFHDVQEGSVNVLNAAAVETGEAAALEAARDQLTALLPSEGARASDSALAAYCAVLQRTAPRSYAAVWKRQRRLLEMAQLDAGITRVITLPDPV